MLNQKMLVSFLGFWVANAVTFLVLSMILPGNVVLGNDKITAPMAAVLSGLILTIIQFLVQPALEKSGFLESLRSSSAVQIAGLKIKNQNAWPAIYLVVNFVGIWVIKRLAQVTGLGVSSFLFVLIAAIVVTAAGWGVAQLTGQMPKNK